MNIRLTKNGFFHNVFKDENEVLDGITKCLLESKTQSILTMGRLKWAPKSNLVSRNFFHFCKNFKGIKI